ncbi:MAG: tyrosine-type recombinase/integrase [Gammaproteobacteria bacterium]|nr:tyrosine-type recombinase/integrase [Gammaproteobacteria bacterium]
MPKYIQKRRRGWYATLDIPKSLRPLFNNKPRFFQSLKTDSETVASRRVLPVIAGWKAQIEAARTGTDDTIEDNIRDWQELLKSSASEGERDGYDYVLSDIAHDMDKREAGSGVSFYKAVSGEYVTTSKFIEEWFCTLDNEPKTLDMKRSDLLRLSRRFPLTKDVVKSAVVRWTIDLRSQGGLSAATTRRIISACRGYWSHLQKIGIVPDDIQPFDKVVKPRSKKSKAEVSRTWLPFKPDEVVSLLHAAVERPGTNGRQLAQLIWMGMWSGCRIEELCALKTSDVFTTHFSIQDAKTPSGWREVPTHKELQPLMASLCANSTDGYVLSALSNDKYGDRSPAIGKRFGRLKTSFGYNERFVFHSIRKTVVTQLDHAGIRENVTADIVGHDIPTMTYGLYSGGSSLAVKAEAIALLSYASIQQSVRDLM